jgi:hypothetical protein
MAKKTTKNAVATQNESWGFWGALSQRGLDAAKLLAAWNTAIATLSDELEVAETDARLILDSRIGRHLADQVPEPCGPALVGKTIQALMATPGWRRDARRVLVAEGSR